MDTSATVELINDALRRLSIIESTEKCVLSTRYMVSSETLANVKEHLEIVIALRTIIEVLAENPNRQTHRTVKEIMVGICEMEQVVKSWNVPMITELDKSVSVLDQIIKDHDTKHQ